MASGAASFKWALFSPRHPRPSSPVTVNRSQFESRIGTWPTKASAAILQILLTEMKGGKRWQAHFKDDGFHALNSL